MFDLANPLHHRLLDAGFSAFKREQADRQGRVLTPFDKSVGSIVARASMRAMQDVRDDHPTRNFHVVSAPTGSGKTVSSIAFIAAASATDQDWSCAYVVETVRLVDEVYEEIVALIGPENVTPYSWGHAADRNDEEVRRKQGFLPSRTATKEDMKTARVLVTTHTQWRLEAQKGVDWGVTHWHRPDGTVVRRDVVYVDEHPQLVGLIERTPGDVVRLRDALQQSDPDHPWVPLLSAVGSRMESRWGTKGANYAAAELVTADEAAALDDEGELHAALRDTWSEAFELTRQFLVAAGRGCVFLQRLQPASFVAYRFDFNPGPGHVLLDATADLTGSVVILPGAESLEVPKVSYENLRITHVPLPPEFSKRSVFDYADTATAYAEWIKKTLLENTEPGDRVLLVSHLKLFQQGRLETAEDPESPWQLEGRLVSTIHWGIGIGTNKYKDCNVVLEAGEYHIPRKRVVADVLGWTGRKATARNLGDANKPRSGGQYLTAYEGHLLRWGKQAASRGSLRSPDAEGRCGRMKLVKTMDRARLLENLDRMYPGAPAPALRGKSSGFRGKRKDPVGPLIDLLADARETVIDSTRVTETTGVAGKHFKKLVDRKSVQAAMARFGWTFIPGRGRGNPSRLERTEADAAADFGISKAA